MKTPVHRDIAARLEQLNDQLRFFTFAEHELLDRLEDFGPAVRHNFTSDMFARNPHAPRIHVRLSELPAFQEANRAFTFGAYVSTSYEVVTTFFPRAVAAAAEHQVQIAPPGERAPEIKYAENVINAGWPPLQDTLVQLLTFIRLRRNGFIHLHDMPDARFTSFCSEAGNELNRRWKIARDSLDFTIPAVGGFSETEAVACLKLLRIALLALDEHLALSLGEERIVLRQAELTFGTESVVMTDTTADRRARKLTSIVKLQFGFVPTASVVQSAVRQVGVWR